MNYKEVFQLAREKGHFFRAGEPTNNGEYYTEDINEWELTLIQKWLRKEHGIHVQPQKTFHNKTYIIGKIPHAFRILGKGCDNSWGKPNSYINAPKKKFETYEEALLIGIETALKLLP